MANERREDDSNPSDELTRAPEAKTDEPHPQPTREEAAQEIAAEDRFEATDN